MEEQGAHKGCMVLVDTDVLVEEEEEVLVEGALVRAAPVLTTLLVQRAR